MANEAIIVNLLGDEGDVIEYTVPNTEAVPKGTLMTLSGARGCLATSGINKTFIGIASTEKVANDGSTNLGLYTKGIFDLMVVGAVGIGEPVKLSGANTVCRVPTSEIVSGAYVGKILETGVDGARAEVAIGVY